MGLLHRSARPDLGQVGWVGRWGGGGGLNRLGRYSDDRSTQQTTDSRYSRGFLFRMVCLSVLNDLMKNETQYVIVIRQ